MSEPLDVTRRQLREYLLPASRSLPLGDEDKDGDHFPRSKVMRFAFNPGNRRILMFSGSILAVMATRIVGTDAMGMVANIARSLAGKKR